MNITGISLTPLGHDSGFNDPNDFRFVQQHFICILCEKLLYKKLELG